MLKTRSFSYRGTLHLGTPSVPARDSPSVTHAELAAGTVPHLVVVPYDAVMDAAPLGGDAFLAANSRTLYFALPLGTRNSDAS